MFLSDFATQGITEWNRIPIQELKGKAKEIYNIEEYWEWFTICFLTAIYVIKLKRKTTFGDIFHIALHKTDMIKSVLEGIYNPSDNSDEPTYEEKVKIISKLRDIKNKVFIEVFPDQRKLVDAVDVYHIWEIDKDKFPFETEDAFILPEDKEWERECVNGVDIEYMVKTKKSKLGKIAYFYLRRVDGEPLSWKEKQFLKNELQHEELTAIEIISEKGIRKPTCLIYLPIGTTKLLKKAVNTTLADGKKIEALVNLAINSQITIININETIVYATLVNFIFFLLTKSLIFSILKQIYSAVFLKYNSTVTL